MKKDGEGWKITKKEGRNEGKKKGRKEGWKEGERKRQRKIGGPGGGEGMYSTYFNIVNNHCASKKKYL